MYAVGGSKDLTIVRYEEAHHVRKDFSIRPADEMDVLLATKLRNRDCLLGCTGESGHFSNGKTHFVG
jgi:hypothetical protein